MNDIFLLQQESTKGLRRGEKKKGTHRRDEELNITRDKEEGIEIRY